MACKIVSTIPSIMSTHPYPPSKKSVDPPGLSADDTMPRRVWRQNKLKKRRILCSARTRKCVWRQNYDPLDDIFPNMCKVTNTKICVGGWFMARDIKKAFVQEYSICGSRTLIRSKKYPSCGTWEKCSENGWDDAGRSFDSSKMEHGQPIWNHAWSHEEVMMGLCRHNVTRLSLRRTQVSHDNLWSGRRKRESLMAASELAWLSDTPLRIIRRQKLELHVTICVAAQASDHYRWILQQKWKSRMNICEAVLMGMVHVRKWVYKRHVQAGRVLRHERYIYIYICLCRWAGLSFSLSVCTDVKKMDENKKAQRKKKKPRKKNRQEIKHRGRSEEPIEWEK